MSENETPVENEDAPPAAAVEEHVYAARLALGSALLRLNRKLPELGAVYADLERAEKALDQADAALSAVRS